jgi:hypothetical protein
MKHFTLALLAVCSLSATAQQAELPSLYQYEGWAFAGRVYFDQLDTVQADKEGVKDSVTTLQLAGDYNSQTWKTTLWLDILMYNDERPFSQWVEGSGWSNNGDISKEKSTAGGMALGVATGPQWVFGANSDNAVYLQAGFDAVIRSTREIASCSNCYSEDIKLDGGAVVVTGVEHHGENWFVGANLRHHLSGDIKSGFGLTLGYKF